MRRVLAIICCGVPFAAPGVSSASGGPVSPIQGHGVTAPGSTVSYVAIGAGRDTVVRRVRRADGKLERSSRLSGSFGVAGAANDGATTGLSPDGRTLVLAGMASAYPPRRTTLLVLDTGRLVDRARIVLPGYYTVDAISPTGRWLYLIHYTAPTRDTTRYEVRAYDLPGRHLMREPVVDPRDRGEAMLGLAIARTMSADGRWAYTLYDRPGSTPFIHALDTERRAAVCIDLPAMPEQDVFGARLALEHDGGTLHVERSGTTLASLNTRTFAVGIPGAKRRPMAARRASSSPDGGGPWWALGAAPLIALGALALLRRRSRRACVRTVLSDR
jgi:MYXO-CTERM domain-containing protein